MDHSKFQKLLSDLGWLAKSWALEQGILRT